MSRDEPTKLRTAAEVRIELKSWETSFAKANGGRKPGREDIKKDAAIVAKYKEYDNLRRKPAKTQTTPGKSTKSTPKKAEQNVLRERSHNAIAATPSKSDKHGKTLHAPELSAVQEEEPTPAAIRFALGPTPQKDGAVLGIFDMLSAGTPSKTEPKLLDPTSEALVAATPTKPAAPPPSDPNLSKTPQSSGKRYYLDNFAGTPLKRKREDSDYTPATSKKLFVTPSFLRRNWPLSRIDDDTHEQPAAGPSFKKRPLVRSLSTIIQGLKKQEEKRMDDEWDLMNEMEAEERGETIKPAAPPAKILVEDSQAAEAEMPLGPDRGVESSEDEGERDPGALDANGNPRKVWKKKGLKRQTRRVIMRPVLQKSKSAPGALLQGRDGGDENEDEVVEETQMPDQPPRPAGDDDVFIDDDASDADGRHNSQRPRHEKGKNKKKALKCKEKDIDTQIAEEKEKQKQQEKKPKKVKPEAHANFRKLKIKNKNSKANGRGGRFGRR